MSFRVRTGRPTDLPSIVPWTQETFAWGDYVPDRLPGWLEDDEGEVLVCVDESDAVLALTHVMMLSGNEGWLEAARVHPDHRRSGLGKALNHAGVEWCRSRGAQVARLATEADNEPAIRQVVSLDYRQTSSWLYAKWNSEDTRRHDRLGLSTAAAPDADAAWVFWSTSDLAAASRGLLAENWRWRKARVEDLVMAAAGGCLHQSSSGWAVVTAVDHDPDFLRADWVAATARDMPGLMDDLVDLAARREKGLYVRLPNVPWVLETLTRAGRETSGILVFEKAV